MQKQPVILPDVMSSKSLKCKGKSTPFAGTLPCKCKHKAPLWVARAWFDQLNPNQLGFDPLRLLACWADKEVRGCKTGTFSLAFLANELRSFSKREGNLQKIEQSFMTVVVIPPNMTTAETLFLGIFDLNTYRNASAIIWRSTRPCQS